MQFELLVNNIALLGLIPVFLLILLTLWSIYTSTGRGRTRSFVAFLISVSVAVAWSTTTLTRMGILSRGFPSSDWTLWGQYLDWGFRGAYTFLIAIYVIVWAFPDFFSERKWAFIVALIGSIVYEILMFSAFSISYSMYSGAWLVTGLVLSVLYMAVIPVYATLRYTQQDRIRGSPLVKWIWVTLLGLLIWFFGEALLFTGIILELPGGVPWFSAIDAMNTSSLVIAWFLILVGFVFQARTSQPDTS